jgi:hypothetical protein
MPNESNLDLNPEIEVHKELIDTVQNALRVLRELQPIIDEARLKESQEKLNARLYLEFKMGERIGATRSITPAPATQILYRTLDTLKISPQSQTRIIDDVTQGVDGLYKRATRNYMVSEGVMELGAKFWIYSTAVFAVFDRLNGKVK